MYERGRDEDAGAEAQQDGADDVLAPGVLAPVGPAHEAPEKNVNSYEIFENLDSANVNHGLEIINIWLKVPLNA